MMPVCLPTQTHTHTPTRYRICPRCNRAVTLQALLAPAPGQDDRPVCSRCRRELGTDHTVQDGPDTPPRVIAAYCYLFNRLMARVPAAPPLAGPTRWPQDPAAASALIRSQWDGPGRLRLALLATQRDR